MSDLSYTQYLLKKQQILMAGQPALPTEFEVIVIGTGLEESIVAASVARNGHSVLHIDTKDYYGEAWAAFNLKGIQEWKEDLSKVQSDEVPKEELEKLLKEGEKLHILDRNSSISDVKESWFVDDDNEENQEIETDEKTDAVPDPTEVKTEAEGTLKPESTLDPEDNVESKDESVEVAEKQVERSSSQEKKKNTWTKSQIMNERMFNLDLTPRLLYSRGSMVDLLIQSNISRYTEFKSVTRVLTVLNGMLEHVPSSRADVFATRHVSVVEKRILMKYLTFCLSYQDNPEVFEAYQSRPYYDFLKHQKLTENLIHFVIHSIAMVDKSINTLDGLKATQKFLASLGRFGNTPFLYSSFGSGELPQAFCRLCAVFGGTYYLGRSIDAIITDANDNCIGILSNGLRISCQKLVMRGQTCPPDLRSNGEAVEEVIERRICLINESILPSEKEQLTFVSCPPANANDGFTFVTEAGHGACVCPRGMYCLHLTKKSSGNGESTSLQQSFDSIMPNAQSKLLWSLDFKVATETFSSIEACQNSLYLTSGPHFELDYDRTIASARQLYFDMYPEEPFLPRAPDPEEIILGETEAEEENPTEEEEKHTKEEEKHTEETSSIENKKEIVHE